MSYDPLTYNLEANPDLQDIWDNAVAHGADTILEINNHTEAFKLQMELYKHRKAMIEQGVHGNLSFDDLTIARETLAPYQSIKLRLFEGGIRFTKDSVYKYNMIDAHTGEQV